MGLGQDSRGYAMAALLVGMSVMAVLLSAAMPVWTTFTKREKEAELIWRGEQYARAVGLFQRKYANTFPPTIDILVEQRFLRKKYKDPITGEDFQPIPAGGGMPPGAIQPPGGGGTRQPLAPGAQQPQTPPSFPTRPNSAGPGAQSAQGGQGAGPFGQPPRPGASVGPGQPAIGVQGVVSKSGDTALKIYNGRTKYNEWAFVYLATARQPVPAGAQRPGGAQGPGPAGSKPNGTTFSPFGGTDRRPPVTSPQPPRPPGS